MSIAEQITRINGEKQRIAAVTTKFGITNNDAVNIKTIADAMESVVIHNCTDQYLYGEGQKYDIVPGYHKGGTVYWVQDSQSEATRYLLETGRKVTPLGNEDQTITAGEGYYGLGPIIVEKIPHPYHNVSSVKAEQSDVLFGVPFVDSNGNVVTGSILKYGTVNQVISTNRNDEGEYIDNSYTIQKGYYDGGSVSIRIDNTQEATPSKETQYVESVKGTNTVLGKVKVNPIPDKYQDISQVTATSSEVLKDEWFVSENGILQQGTMENNQGWSVVLDSSKASEDVPWGFHNGHGVVSINLEAKEVTPNKGTQSIIPSKGKVLSVVTVNPIPDKYQDLTNQDLTAADVLDTAKFVAKDGTLTDGTIPNLGVIERYVDPLTDTGWGMNEAAYVRAVSVVINDSNLIAELRKI